MFHRVIFLHVLIVCQDLFLIALPVVSVVHGHRTQEHEDYGTLEVKLKVK